MHTLYWGPGTGAFAVEVVLEELGLAYERVLVDTDVGAHVAPDYLALNPMGQVPTLRLPDGVVVTESAAMILHLCDSVPAAGLLPEPGTSARARAYRWLCWLAGEHYGAALRYYYADRYTTSSEGAADVQAAAAARQDRLFKMAEDLFGAGPYVLGDRYSAIDPYLMMLLLWHPKRQEALELFPVLGAQARRLRGRPAVEKVWREHYPPVGGHPWSTWTSLSVS